MTEKLEVIAKKTGMNDRRKIPDEIEIYRDYPEGSDLKQLFDKYAMNLNEYLDKYYNDQVFNEFSGWNTWFLRIDRVFKEKQLDGFYRMDKNSSDYLNCLSSIPTGYDFPEDIKKTFCFLIVDGFFDHEKTGLINWIENQEVHEGLNVKDCFKKPETLNLLKEKLMYLKWWDFSRGDSQGS